MTFRTPENEGLKVVIPVVMFVLGTAFGFFACWLAGVL